MKKILGIILFLIMFLVLTLKGGSDSETFSLQESLGDFSGGFVLIQYQ